MRRTIRNGVLLLVPLLAAGGAMTAAHAEPWRQIKLCKQGGLGVTGNFTFTIYDPPTQTTQTVVVAAGTCVTSEATKFSAGAAPVIQEAAVAGTSVSSITASGGGSSVVWSDLAQRSVKVSDPGYPWVVTVTFKNVKTLVSGGDTGTVLTPSGATVKLCKVAGPNVAVGTPYTFTVDGGSPVTVPAGPAPGGYCAVVPEVFGVDDQLTVHENPVSGTHVTGAVVSPASQLVSTDLAAGDVVFRTNTGVTEVTFTNAKGPTGWLEICKKLSAPTAAPPFLFTVPGTSVGTISVPAGACSPAFEVPSGQVTVTELGSAGYALLGCATLPAPKLVTCNTTARTATVSVTAGGLATETIVTFTNRKLG